MSEEANTEDGEGLEKKKFSGKKMIMIIVPVILLLAGGGAAFMFMGGDDEAAQQAAVDENGNPVVAVDEQKAAEEEALELLFYDVEPLLVNLSSGGGKTAYLKLGITLEVDKQSSLENLEANLPRVIDNFQVYLRELRVEDINGSAGMFRLKEELLIRVNETLYPTRVNDVLFKEMLVNS